MVSQNSANNTVQDNDFSVNRSDPGTTVQSSVVHSDNTSGTSNAKFFSEVPGTLGGDPHVNFNVAGTQNYSIGIDNSDLDNMKITDSSDPSSGSTYLTFDQATTNIWSDGISFDDGTNVLSFYEEGTWTPEVAFGGSTTGWSYGIQTGRYTRIGRVVYCGFEVTTSNVGTSTGDATMINLPFVCSADNYIGDVLRKRVMGFTGGRLYGIPVVLASTTTVSFQEAGDNISAINLTNTSFGAGSGFSGEFFYFV